MLVENIKYDLDIETFKNLIFEFIELYKVDYKKLGQLSFQYSDSLQDKSLAHIDGTGGTKFHKDYSAYNFKILHPFFQNTIVEKIIEDFSLYRTRILRLKSKEVYTIHEDTEKRIHIPIQTNHKSYLLFTKQVSLFHLDVGNIYKVDTTKEHTYLNGEFVNDRLHVVGCLKND